MADETRGSNNLRAAKNWANQYGWNLTAHEKRFNSNVMVVHDDGSQFNVADAFLVRYVDAGGTEYIAMFAEHHDTQIWTESELVHYAQFGPQEEIKAILDR